MSIKRTITMTLVVLCLIMTTLGSSFAAVNTCRLSSTEKWDWSDTEFSATKAWINSGEVSSSSERGVYFIHAVYPNAGMAKSSYTQDTYILKKPGKTITTPLKSTVYSPKYYFRLLLNVYGDSTTGSIANGKQADYQE